MNTAKPWVVYRIRVLGKLEGNAVCLQSDWEIMERVCPGHHVLVKSGIATEGEAEEIARRKPDTIALRDPSAPSRSLPQGHF